MLIHSNANLFSSLFFYFSFFIFCRLIKGGRSTSYAYFYHIIYATKMWDDNFPCVLSSVDSILFVGSYSNTICKHFNQTFMLCLDSHSTKCGRYNAGGLAITVTRYVLVSREQTKMVRCRDIFYYLLFESATTTQWV